MNGYEFKAFQKIIKKLHNLHRRWYVPNFFFIILMDNFPVHKENVKLIEYDTNLIKVFFLPANTTRLLQPLDISIKNLIKKNLRQLWVSNFTSNESVTRAEMSKRVLESWTKLTVNQIQSGSSDTRRSIHGN